MRGMVRRDLDYRPVSVNTLEGFLEQLDRLRLVTEIGGHRYDDRVLALDGSRDPIAQALFGVPFLPYVGQRTELGPAAGYG